MNKKDLQELVKISPTTIAKMGKGEAISLKILVKIANKLKIDIGDIVSVYREEEANEYK